MTARSKLLWSANELATVEKALRISNAQGGMYMFAMTAPGRTWTVVNNGVNFGSKSFTLRVQSPRTPYIGLRWYAEPQGAGSFRYQVRENGVTVAPDKFMQPGAPGDYAHIHKLTRGLANASPVDPLTIELLLEAATNSLVVRDLQIFGLYTGDLPARVQSFQEWEEFLTTS